MPISDFLWDSFSERRHKELGLPDYASPYIEGETRNQDGAGRCGDLVSLIILVGIIL